MDYEQIQKDCPLAWVACSRYFNDVAGDELTCKGKLLIQDLDFYLAIPVIPYLDNFFDSVGIYVNTNTVSGGNDKTITRYNIQTGKSLNGNSEPFDSRPEAKEAAYTEAFKLLEEQLNK